MSASCVCLWILRICSDRPFYRAPLGNWLFHVQVAGFQPPDAVKRYLTGDFQVFYTRTRSSYSKAFIYLKSLIISCELFVKKLISAIWKSRHQHLRISISASASALQKKSCEVFIFVFRSISWRKYQWWSPFQVHLHTLLEVSAAV